MKYFVTVAGREVEVIVDGDQVTVDGRQVAAHLVHFPGTPLVQLSLEGRRYPLAVAGRDDDGWRLVDHGAVREVNAVDERTRHIRSLVGQVSGVAGGGVVKAPMPGMVVKLLVEVGQRVAAGDGLLLLEAMKMENELKAPGDGVVESISTTVGQAVEKGEVLVRLAALPSD